MTPRVPSRAAIEAALATPDVAWARQQQPAFADEARRQVEVIGRAMYAIDFPVSGPSGADPDNTTRCQFVSGAVMPGARCTRVGGHLGAHRIDGVAPSGADGARDDTARELLRSHAWRHPDLMEAMNILDADATALGFEDLTPNLSDAEKVWRCRSCGVEQDSGGPIPSTAPTAPQTDEHIERSIRMRVQLMTTAECNALFAEAGRGGTPAQQETAFRAALCEALSIPAAPPVVETHPARKALMQLYAEWLDLFVARFNKGEAPPTWGGAAAEFADFAIERGVQVAASPAPPEGK